MKSLEHRAVGEAATGGACVNVGAETVVGSVGAPARTALVTR
jgi:hypothetical protein